MRKIREWILRFGGLFNKRRKDRELDAEIESHLQLHIEENLRLGMTHEEAGRQALIKLGGIESTKEAYRDQRGLPVLETLWQDIRYGARMLRKNPGFTAVAVLTLALGIGATTTIFSVVYHVLLRLPPFLTDANRLMFIWEHAPTSAPGQRERIDYRNYQEFKVRFDVFQQMAAFQTAGRFLLKTDGGVMDADGQGASHELLPMLGVAPVLGRNFLPEEDVPGGEEVVIISHEIWKSQLGADPGIIGKSIRVNDGSQRVIGVLPANFRLPSWPAPSDFLKPLRLVEAEMPRDRDTRLYVIGRLKPSSSRAQAQAQLNVVAASLRREKWNNPDLTLSAISAPAEIVSRVKPLISLLSGAVAFVLLIACSNIAILLMGHSSAREREVVIRSALGAGRQRLICQFLTESMLLFMIGGVLAIFLAIWGCQLLARLSPHFVLAAPRMADLSVNWAMLAFTFAVSLVSGLLFGLFPAWKQSVRSGAHLVARESTSIPSNSRFRGGLMTAEFALVLVLLVGACLMTRSMHKLLAADPGFVSEKLFFLDVNLDDQPYSDRAQKAEFYHRLLSTVRSLPGIDSAALVQYRPLLSEAKYTVVIEGQPAPPNNQYPKVEYRPVSEGYFATLGASMIQGRTLESEDMRPDSTAIVISRVMARRFWGEKDPIGKRLMVEPPKWLTVIGVVEDVRNVRLDAPSDSTLYVPYPTNQRWPNWLTLVIRSRGSLTALSPLLRAEGQQADTNLPVGKIESMDDIVFRVTLQRRLLMTVLQIFAGATIVIAAVGIYGIVAHSVTHRWREIGIRRALGASNRNVLYLFLQRCVLMLALGLTIGLAGAFALVRLLREFLYEIGPQDFLTLAGASAVLAVVALTASYIPARRATRIDPMVALRYE